MLCPKTLWFSKTRYRKAQKRAQFRDRSIENAIEKGSFEPVSWAISGEQNDDIHGHKSMILIWFETFDWWWKRIIKHMHKNDQSIILWTIALAYGGPADHIILETLEIWESIWRKMLPYRDIWTIKSHAGLESNNVSRSHFSSLKCPQNNER